MGGGGGGGIVDLQRHIPSRFCLLQLFRTSDYHLNYEKSTQQALT